MKFACNMPNESSPLRVLAVDDEPLIRWSLSETLGDRGDVVIEAGSGQEAMRAFADSAVPVDVVLLDYKLPDSYHLDVLMALHQLSPTSQVIVMSAHCTPEIAKEALASGAYRVVTKPIDMKDVPALVREAANARAHPVP